MQDDLYHLCLVCVRRHQRHKVNSALPEPDLCGNQIEPTLFSLHCSPVLITRDSEGSRAETVISLEMCSHHPLWPETKHLLSPLRAALWNLIFCSPVMVVNLRLYSQVGHRSTPRSDPLGFSCSGQPRSTDYCCNKITREMCETENTCFETWFSKIPLNVNP